MSYTCIFVLRVARTTAVRTCLLIAGRNDLMSRQSEFASRATTAMSSIAPAQSGMQSAVPPYNGAPSGRSTAVARAQSVAAQR